MKKITIIGCTGSIGTQTLNIIRKNRALFEVVALSGGFHDELEQMLLLVEEFQPQLVYMIEEKTAKVIMEKTGIKCIYGDLEKISEVCCDLFINSVVGSVGLKPTVSAIKKGYDIGLANKETLVIAGKIIMELAKKHDVKILPIDSEHSAIYQCLNGEDLHSVNKIILTASGGSFRDKTRLELSEVTLEDALNHPNWSMGAKITIDSATMMNKGLEVIEAHYLFDVPYENIEVILHQESVIHSLVEFHDKSIIAQLGTPNMEHPISYVLNYPNRLANDDKRLSLSDIGTLHFLKPSFERYEALKIAYECGEYGGTKLVVMNASNEAAVKLFLENKIHFLDIEKLIKKALMNFKHKKDISLNEIISIDLLIKEQVTKEYKKWV